MSQRVIKTDQDWQQELTPEQYRVCREKGTEPPFSGEYDACHADGVYACVCCGAELFRSEHKYDSGSGWPSFFRPATESAVIGQVDNSHGMRRVEILCQHCGAHLGHVFDDGPAPTGLRYCVNSVALKLEKT